MSRYHRDATIYKECYMYRSRKPYSFGAFLFDALMVCITGGLWGIRIFVREMRNR